jgi:hypothetical protein
MSEYVEICKAYRAAVDSKDEFTIRKLQANHPEHSHTFSVIFTAVCRRKRYEKKFGAGSPSLRIIK